jgi:hypothetical protein
MAASTTASLYRNGQVMMRRDADGNTAESSGVALEPHKMSVRNARLLAGDLALTCATNGFELVAQPLADTSLDFTDHTQVVNDYYPQCAAVVEQITGAHAYAFDHNVRSATGKRNANASPVASRFRNRRTSCTEITRCVRRPSGCSS